MLQTNHRGRRAFTIIELSAILCAAAVLLACAIAVTAQQKNDANYVRSKSNLKNIGIGCVTYAAEYNDRQPTFVNDNISKYGQTMDEALKNFTTHFGQAHPGILLGWSQKDGGAVQLSMDDPANHWVLMPISFDQNPRGSFRFLNVKQFNVYLNGRFYDPIFYAPADEPVMKAVAPFLENPAEFEWPVSRSLYWSSYCWSAAAMYSPGVFQQPKPDGSGGFTDPFKLTAGFRSPSLAQAMYPDLKTHVIEHHWLQNRPAWATACNDKHPQGTYDGCEPHHFNHYAYSEPLSLFYDGHLESMLVKDALDADKQVRTQMNTEVGLWFPKPGGATDGYFESLAADPTRASFHVFTVDGIKGRDRLSALVQPELPPAPRPPPATQPRGGSR